MAAKSTITINDGQATPVVRNFTALQSLNDFESWSDKTSGITIGQPSLTLSIRRPSKNLRSNKIRLQIATPTLEVTAPSTTTGYQPAPKVAYTTLATVDIICPDRNTLAERKDILAFVKNALSNAHVVSAVENAEMPY